MQLRERKPKATPEKPSPQPKEKKSRKRKAEDDEDEQHTKKKKTNKRAPSPVEPEPMQEEPAVEPAIEEHEPKSNGATVLANSHSSPAASSGATTNESPKHAKHPPPLHRSFSREATRVEDYYELLEQLGSGSFATVFRAKQLTNHDECAIKMISSEVFRRNQESTEREIEVLSKLSHPGIVKLREVVRTASHVCIVMELCRGGELFDRIVAREKYTEHDARLLVRTMLTAVAYLHEHGIVHRDLKPENLIFDAPGDDAKLKITDFGLATVLDAQGKLTKFCGTPEYVAPEILSSVPYDAKVDMWSVGVILYILLCGFPPFYAETNAELFEQIKGGDFEFVSPYFDPVSPQAKNLVSNLLQLDPAKRLSAQEALHHDWFSMEATEDAPALPSTQTQLSLYNATRRLRRGVIMVIALNRMRQLMQHVESSLEENTQDAEQQNE